MRNFKLRFYYVDRLSNTRFICRRYFRKHNEAVEYNNTYKNTLGVITKEVYDLKSIVKINYLINNHIEPFILVEDKDKIF